MGMEIQQVFEQIHQSPKEKPYMPFSAAMECGMFENPELMADDAVGSPGVELASGRIPNHKGAGLMWFSNSVGAFDHVSVESRGNEIILTPTSKTDVDHDGNIVNEGIVVLANNEGRLKIAAMAIDVFKRPWLADRIGRFPRVALGRIAVFPEISTQMPDYEIDEVDSKDGIIRARERRRIIPFGS